MALIDCWECKTQVSDQAAACPRCGAPVSKPSGVPLEESQLRPAPPPLPPSVRSNGVPPLPESACPFCQSRLATEAVVCPSCHAWYGYREGIRPHTAKSRFILGCIFFGLGIVLGVLIPIKRGGSVFALISVMAGLAYWFAAWMARIFRGKKQWYRQT